MSWEPITPRFDELIHMPTRLRITAALATATDMEFNALEEALQISTSLLSKQLRVLVDAGYVKLDKRPQRTGRPRTWVSLTTAGRRAYLGHIKALKELIGSDEYR
ncbi:transcriptional regulator [Propionimicrobium sp. PCR01-08-3]|uniref:transcriptional regulator n=1 Tax=Propionimicrobium sp. PCR01-08-3 TaxID=3052086 RepID=UPI00255CF500|nr:transcriptional regulator [Propionimicrobium sp. PCR01-08-3]WIY82211.1 transcriptional regulator [Propionimicrobium sp. PCR01-08-3]